MPLSVILKNWYTWTGLPNGTVIFLDSHIVIWLHNSDIDRLSEKARSLLEVHELAMSPMVLFELQYLYEIGKYHCSPQQVLNDLREEIGLEIANDNWLHVIQMSMSIDWTRDPFDRCIVAHAQLRDAPLLTKDQTILQRYQHAVWE